MHMLGYLSCFIIVNIQLLYIYLKQNSAYYLFSSEAFFSLIYVIFIIDDKN